MGQGLTVESIVKDLGTRLFNLAYRICGDEFLAEDLLQESLLQIHKALPSFRGESSAHTWAYKITLNTCLKRSRGNAT
jgi:RNA polymerase sigma-70 factor (ECF subfamily)